ncbi:MAG: GspE/PulE family protein [Pirellulaceae bacterium]
MSTQTINAPEEHGKYWAEFSSTFPIEFCRRHEILGVLDADDLELALTTADTPRHIVDVVGRAMKRPVRTRVVDKEELAILTNRLYERAVEAKRTAGDAPTLEEFLGETVPSERVDDLLETDSHGATVKLVNDLLLEAIQARASDIHLQPFEDHVIVRMRMDGVLEDIRKLPRQIQDEVISRLKVAGRMNIAERRLPQDGRATVRVGDRTIDLRLASMPTNYGERMVVRLLDKSARLYRLAELGMDEFSLERFRRLIGVEHGLVLVTGPTGSGKSTTLYAALQELDTRSRNAVTLEDPIEYQLDGISQTQINTKKGMTFASGLRSVLRQDPDIIMVGEIRDQETAVMAVQAALTGHLVFSTLHTNDASSAVTRMLDLGIEPYLVASSVLGVLAQRLVRRVCAECKGTPADEHRCGACRGTGYRGREGIYELLLVTDTIRKQIQERVHAAEIRDAGVRDGMRLLRECGELKIAQGLTTPEEVERVTMRTEL